MTGNINLIESFAAQGSNFIATATAKEIAIWVVDETGTGFVEMLRKDFTEYAENDDSIRYFKPLITEDDFKMIIGFEYGKVGIWDLADADEFELIKINDEGIAIIEVLNVKNNDEK